MPRLETVASSGKMTVTVTWAEGSPRFPRVDVVDLSPLIGSLKFFKPLRRNPRLFQTVRLSARGRALLWGEEDGTELDMGASSVQHLAEQMMSAEQFEAFLQKLKYTQNTAAAQLGYSRRQIAYFLSGKSKIPRVCALACWALEKQAEPPPKPVKSIIEVQITTTDMTNVLSDTPLGVHRAFDAWGRAFQRSKNQIEPTSTPKRRTYASN